MNRKIITSFIVCYILLFLFTSGMCQGKILTGINPYLADLNTLSNNSTWQAETVSGSATLHSYAGQLGCEFDLNTGEKYVETMIYSGFQQGFNFLGITEPSTLMSLRTFYLLRSLLLPATYAQSQSFEFQPECIGITGFTWAGPREIAVFGTDKLAFFTDSGNRILVFENKIKDYTQLHESEYHYVDIIKNGMYPLFNTNYSPLAQALNDYVSYWSDMGYNFENVYILETPEHMEIREDLTNRLTNADNDNTYATPVSDFTTLVNWVAQQGNFAVAMFRKPETETADNVLNQEFFEDALSQEALDYFTLIEVNQEDSMNLNSPFVAALKEGWKLAPVAKYSSTGLFDDTSTSFFTGIWSERLQDTTGGTGNMAGDTENAKKILDALRKRRTYVGNMKQGAVKFYITDSNQNTLAVMGDTFTQNIPVQFNVAITHEENDQYIYILQPRLITIFNDKTARFAPLTSLYHNTNLEDRDETPLYFKRVDSINNLAAAYAYCRVIRVNKENCQEGWSYHTIREKSLSGKIHSSSFHLTSAPIYF